MDKTLLTRQVLDTSFSTFGLSGQFIGWRWPREIQLPPSPLPEVSISLLHLWRTIVENIQNFYHVEHPAPLSHTDVTKMIKFNNVKIILEIYCFLFFTDSWNKYIIKFVKT